MSQGTLKDLKVIAALKRLVAEKVDVTEAIFLHILEAKRLVPALA